MADQPVTTQNMAPEFMDILSNTFLITPDQDFFFARMCNAAAINAQMRAEDGWDLLALQLREGRPPSGANIPANIVEAMGGGEGRNIFDLGVAYPDFVRMVAEAKATGETIKINRPQFINGKTTESARRLSQNTRVFGTNSQNLKTDQVDVTIVEYGGPGDTATGAVTPINVGEFSKDRARHDLILQTGMDLRRDRNKFVDDLAYARHIAAVRSDGIIRGGIATSDATFTGAGNEPMTLSLLFQAGEILSGRGVPGVGGTNKYLALVDIRQMTQLKDDKRYQKLAVFEEQWNPLFPGYAKTVENLLIVPINTTAMRVTNLGASTNITGYSSLVLAPGSYGWANAMDAKVIRDRNDDGGRFNAFAWKAHEGWQILDDRWFVQVQTS